MTHGLRQGASSETRAAGNNLDVARAIGNEIYQIIEGREGRDVLILDLHLRKGSGFGILRSLSRGKRRRPKIIILTNFGLPEYRREAESFGIEAFLDKSRDYFRLPSLLTGFARERSAPPAQ